MAHPAPPAEEDHRTMDAAASTPYAEAANANGAPDPAPLEATRRG